MEKSVFIAVPQRPRVDSRFVGPFNALINTTAQQGVPLTVRHGFGSPLWKVRNSLTRAFMASDKTHLFFLDDDVIPPANAIIKLLSHNLPIVSGMYRRRDDPHYPILLYLTRNRKTGHVTRFSYRHKFKPPKGLIKCHATGAGCLLIERSVLEKIGDPWFVAHDKPFLGEDIDFCLKGLARGYGIYVDTRVECLHIVEHISASKAAIKDFEKKFGFKMEFIG